MENVVHTFTRSGLGKAPFQFLDMFERRHPETRQPTGTCAHCGTSIVFCCLIVSADGRKFEVGNECVLKTGDAGLIDVTKERANRLRNAARRRSKYEKEEAFLAAAWEKFEAVRSILEKHTHPFDSKKTAADYYDYCANNYGGVRYKIDKLLQGVWRAELYAKAEGR